MLRPFGAFRIINLDLVGLEKTSIYLQRESEHWGCHILMNYYLLTTVAAAMERKKKLGGKLAESSLSLSLSVTFQSCPCI